MLIISVLLQSAPPVDFIRDHSSLVAWVIGVLLAVVVAQFTLSGVWIKTKFTALERADEERSKKAHEDHTRIEGRVDEVDLKVEMVKEQVIEYKSHVGVGEAQLSSLKQRIEHHMDDEKKIVWQGMKDLSEKLTVMALENVNAHAHITERVSSLEAKLPNGDTARLTKLLESVLKAQKIPDV